MRERERERERNVYDDNRKYFHFCLDAVILVILRVCVYVFGRASELAKEERVCGWVLSNPIQVARFLLPGVKKKSDDGDATAAAAARKYKRRR